MTVKLRNIVCLAVLLLFAVDQKLAAVVEQVSHEELACNACHRTDSEGLPQVPREALEREAEICRDCHDQDRVEGGHHSVFVAARTLPPAELPLTADGMITCSTCHNLHERGPSLLRGETKWLCQACHSDT